MTMMSLTRIVMKTLNNDATTSWRIQDSVFGGQSSSYMTANRALIPQFLNCFCHTIDPIASWIRHTIQLYLTVLHGMSVNTLSAHQHMVVGGMLPSRHHPGAGRTMGGARAFLPGGKGPDMGRQWRIQIWWLGQGHGRGSGRVRVHPPRRRKGVWGAKAQTIFSLDMLLENHFGVNNDAKFTHVADGFRWTIAQNVTKNIRDTMENV